MKYEILFDLEGSVRCLIRIVIPLKSKIIPLKPHRQVFKRNNSKNTVQKKSDSLLTLTLRYSVYYS